MEVATHYGELEANALHWAREGLGFWFSVFFLNQARKMQGVEDEFEKRGV